MSGKNIEVKPKLYTNKRTNGGGNFTDLTINRLEEIRNDNVNVVTSLFAHDRLVYIMEFPIKTIYTRLYTQVHEKCVVKKQQYCRSANFTYIDYIDSSQFPNKF